MAVIIERDNQSTSTRLIPPRKHNVLDTVLLYVVGFVGLIGSVYLLHLNRVEQAHPFNKENNPEFLSTDPVSNATLEAKATYPLVAPKSNAITVSHQSN